MVNLMDNAAKPSESAEHLIVDVKDHDINVPADLGGNGLPFWKQEEMKIWLYILGAAVLILVVVFALLSQQTSLFQGRTKLPTNTDTVAVDETETDDFNTSAANEENRDESTGEGDFVTDPNTDDGVSIDDILNGQIDSTTDEIVDDGNTDDTFDDGLDFLLDDDPVDEIGFDVFIPDEEPILTDPFGESETFNGYAAASDETNIESEIAEPSYTNTDLGPDLSSNTDLAVVDSPNMQGDTGPAPLVALVPSMFYALAHFRKRK